MQDVVAKVAQGTFQQLLGSVVKSSSASSNLVPDVFATRPYLHERYPAVCLALATLAPGKDVSPVIDTLAELYAWDTSNRSDAPVRMSKCNRAVERWLMATFDESKCLDDADAFAACTYAKQDHIPIILNALDGILQNHIQDSFEFSKRRLA